MLTGKDKSARVPLDYVRKISKRKWIVTLVALLAVGALMGVSIASGYWRNLMDSSLNRIAVIGVRLEDEKLNLDGLNTHRSALREPDTAIADALSRDASFGTVELSDATFSTSGDYERFFMKDGRRYHHIIDLATGQPARASRSVTIVASSATLADGLSKAVFVLGAPEGMALIERVPGVEGVIVSATNEVLVSKGLKERFRLVAPPTDAP